MNTFILAALLSFTPGGLAGRPTPTACQSLDSLHPTKLVYPTDAQYNVTNQNFFDSSSIKRPSCIFLPETAKDVSAALKIIRKHSGTKFAVKSGGHMPGEFNNIDDGVLIATEKLDTLQWADNDSVLRVGPGLRWGPVYDKAAEKGKIVIGGRLKVVGVAGLVIGGGISYVSGEYGFACDNVKGFEIVLADGTISYASATRKPDLYKALRGGASNFGIVTRFDLDAYPLPLGWSDIATTVLNPAPGVDLKPQFLSALADYVVTGAAKDLKSGSIITITRVPSQGITLGMMSLWSSTPSANATADIPEVFAPLLAVPAQHSIDNRPLNVVANTFGSQEATDAPVLHTHNTFRTGSYIADKELIYEIERIHDEEFASIKDIQGLTSTLTFQPITANNVLVGAKKRGGNVLGLETRVKKGGRSFMWTEQYAGWARDEDTERVEVVQRRVYERAKVAAVSRGLFDEFVYLNDASTEQSAEVFGAYGKKNHEFLKAVKKRYDPQGVFAKLMPGGFKL